MRHLAVLTLALLLVLAGCNGAPGSGTTTESTVDAESTTLSETADADSSESRLPPGLSEDGITDAGTLADAHASALANQSYTHHRETTMTAANGSELGRWSQRVQVGANRLAFNFTQTAAGVSVGGTSLDDSRTYTDGTVTFVNASDFSDGYYRTEGRGFAESRFDGERFLTRVLTDSETSVTPVEEDGETWYFVRAESERETVASDSATAGVEVEATNVTATALVAPSGFVENVTYEYDFERGNVIGHRTETVQYAAVGETTVERPAWVAEAEDVLANRLAPGLNESGVTDAGTLADAHANVLRNTSYTVVSNLTARDGRVVRARQNLTTMVARDSTRSLQKSNVSGEGLQSMGIYHADVEIWTDENGSWYAFDGENGTSYQRAGDSSRPASASRTGRDRLFILFAATDTTVADATNENGTTLYRVNATGDDGELLDETLHPGTVENVSMSALIDENGVVRRYRIAYDATVSNGTVRVERDVRFVAVGETTVERPAWYGEAVNQTDDR